jgi:hypothetical protein
MIRGRILRLFLVASLGIVVLSACSSLRSQPTMPSAPFIPPTRQAQTAPAALMTVLPPAAALTSSPSPEVTPTPACSNILAFAADLSIPDGTIVKPGEQLEKRWQVRNSGTCNWDNTYRVGLIAGPALGVPEKQALFPARSGTEAKIRMLFTAPAEPGTYRSAWQAIDPSGEPFGDPFFIEIVVEG